MITIIKNQKGQETVINRGYRYNLSVINKNTTLWRCVNRNTCSATMKLDITKTKILKERRHSCVSDHIKNEVAVAIAECKKKVCQNLGPIQPIYEKVFEQLKIKGNQYLLQIPSFESLKTMLYRERKKFLKSDKLNFKKLKEVIIPEDIAENFLICNDGEENKILIFCSKTSRKIIKSSKSKSYLADGTFRCCPKIFYQLYSLHLDIMSSVNSTNVVPVIYGLLPNKSEETYTRFFKLIKEKLGVSITDFKCDYEQAQINAIEKIYPEASVSGCYHHYNDAIWRKSKELKLNKTRDGRNITRLCSHLPLLPAEYTREAWASIQNIAPQTEEMDKFKEYFVNQWYPKLETIISCAENKHRTTNPVEGFHRRLNSRFPRSPNIFLFIKCLLKEYKHYDFKIKSILFNPEKKNRRNKNIIFDKKYKKLLRKLLKAEITPMSFLKKIVYLRLIH